MDHQPISQGSFKHPMAVLAACFAAGIVLGKYAEHSFLAPIIFASILSTVGLIFRRYTYAAVLIAAAFFFLGNAAYLLQRDNIADNQIKRIYDTGVIISDDPVEIEGRVVGGLRPAFGGHTVDIDVRKIIHREVEMNVAGFVRLFASADEPEIINEYRLLNVRHNDTVRIASRLQREDKYLNPGVITRRQILDQQGIDAAGTIKSPLLIEVLSRNKRSTFFGGLASLRDRLIEEYRTLFSPRVAGVLIAVTLGDDNFLDRRTADAFRASGTFHILVISGLHITFIGGLLLLVFQQFIRNKVIRLLSVVTILWCYVVMTGMQAPSVRAGIVFTLVLTGTSFYRQTSLFNSLGVCAIILLVHDPRMIFDPSFQLTFSSVIAIAVMALPLIENLRMIGTWTPTSERPFPPNVSPTVRRFCETLYWNKAAWNIQRKRHIWSSELLKDPYFDLRKLPGSATVIVPSVEAAIVSLSVIVWMLPLMVIYFHRVAFSGILLNIWVGTIMAVNSLMAAAAVGLKQISPFLAQPFTYLIELGFGMMTIPMEVLIWQGLADVRVPIYSGSFGWIYYLYYASPLVLAFLLAKWAPFSLKAGNKKIKLMLVACLAAIALNFFTISFHPFSAPAGNGTLRVDFLDVGQGDAALITFPNGQTMLIDGGGRPDFRKMNEDESEAFTPDHSRIGEMVVSEFLWEMGYSQIDHVVGTHSDADHQQGLTDVVQNFRVKNVYLSQLPKDDLGSEPFITALDQKGIEPIAAERGLKFEIGGALVEFLYPNEADVNSALGNDGSVVLKISFGNRAFLFTGDIEKQAEELLLSTGQNLLADVIKVPHHGSRTSSTQGLVSAVNAEYAVIPVGRRSIFNHPHSEVVERWQIAGAKVLKTGDKGTITFVTNGEFLKVSEFLK